MRPMCPRDSPPPGAANADGDVHRREAIVEGFLRRLDGKTLGMNDLYFHCVGCRDRRPVSRTRRHCLCGAVSARTVGDAVVLAGPGFITTGSTEGGRDEVRVIRPSTAVGT